MTSSFDDVITISHKGESFATYVPSFIQIGPAISEKSSGQPNRQTNGQTNKQTNRQTGQKQELSSSMIQTIA